MKGYRYYNPAKRQVIISGDVQIVETNVTPLAPAHSNSQSNQVDSSSEFALLWSISFTKLLKLAPIQPGNPLSPTQASMSPPTTWNSDMEESHEFESTVPLSPNIPFQLPIPSTSPQRQPIVTYQRRSTNPPPTEPLLSPLSTAAFVALTALANSTSGCTTSLHRHNSLWVLWKAVKISL